MPNGPERFKTKSRNEAPPTRESHVLTHSDATGASQIIWGAPAIAAAINRPLSTTYMLLERGLLPGARKIGGKWCFAPAKFMQEIAA